MNVASATAEPEYAISRPVRRLLIESVRLGYLDLRNGKCFAQEYSLADGHYCTVKRLEESFDGSSYFKFVRHEFVLYNEDGNKVAKVQRKGITTELPELKGIHCVEGLFAKVMSQAAGIFPTDYIGDAEDVEMSSQGNDLFYKSRRVRNSEGKVKVLDQILNRRKKVFSGIIRVTEYSH